MILLDEPTANLDVDHVIETLTLLRELAAGGATIALALHDLNVVSRWADTVAVLQDGRLRATGPPAEVLGDDLVASVFGGPGGAADRRRRPAGHGVPPAPGRGRLNAGGAEAPDRTLRL